MNIPKLERGPIINKPILIPNRSMIDYKSIVKDMQVDTDKINKSLAEMSEKREERYRDGVSREERMIELLESIDNNTSILNDIFTVLQKNTENQEEILKIINEFNSLATTNNVEQAQTLYRKLMTKINTTLSDINTINTLCTYGMTIYNVLHSIGKI